MPFCDDWSDRSLFLLHLPKVLPGFNELFIKCFGIFWWKQSGQVHGSHCIEGDMHLFTHQLGLSWINNPFLWTEESSSNNTVVNFTCEERQSYIKFLFLNFFELARSVSNAGWIWDFGVVHCWLIGCFFEWSSLLCCCTEKTFSKLVRTSCYELVRAELLYAGLSSVQFL